MSVQTDRRRAFRVRLAVLGLTAGEAAALAEISKGYFSSVMNGRYTAPDRVAERIAAALQVDRMQLFI